MTTTRFVRPLGLWEYLDAGGVLADVLPRRAGLLADQIFLRSRRTRAGRLRLAASYRAYVEDYFEHGGDGRYSVPMVDGSKLPDDEVQELIWLVSFEADLYECEDEAQVERVLALLPEDEVDEARRAYVCGPNAPLRVGVIGQGAELGWECDNCGVLHEPGEAEALIVATKSEDLTYCRACVDLAAQAMRSTFSD